MASGAQDTAPLLMRYLIAGTCVQTTSYQWVLVVILLVPLVCYVDHVMHAKGKVLTLQSRCPLFDLAIG